MKTNKLLTKKTYLIINIILFVLILGDIILGFGDMFSVTNLTSNYSISFFDYAFKTNMSNHLASALHFNVIYLFAFILILISICMCITTFALKLMNKNFKKLQLSFLITILVTLVLIIVLSLLSKVIYLNDIKKVVILPQYEKLWQYGKIGDGAICLAIFGFISLIPAALMLYLNGKCIKLK